MVNKYDYTIIVDTREQKPWEFTDFSTSVAKLDTGDYSIKGLEDILCIERKRSISEIAGNITEKRFEDVLTRMSEYKFPFILLEFGLDDVFNFPIGSDIPKKLWNRIKIKPQFILKNLIEMALIYNINVIYCGNKSNAEEYALAIMNKVYQKYGKQNKQ